jgi:hypothetical protein
MDPRRPHEVEGVEHGELAEHVGDGGGLRRVCGRGGEEWSEGKTTRFLWGEVRTIIPIISTRCSLTLAVTISAASGMSSVRQRQIMIPATAALRHART